MATWRSVRRKQSFRSGGTKASPRYIHTCWSTRIKYRVEWKMFVFLVIRLGTTGRWVVGFVLVKYIQL